MTTATLVAGNRTMDNVVRPRRSLEDLVDQLIAAMFKEEEPRAATQTASVETVEPSAVRSIHEARRLRQAGDVDAALAVLADVETAKAASREARWAFGEWKQLVKRQVRRPRTPWSTARARDGLPGWCPATMGTWRS